MRATPAGRWTMRVCGMLSAVSVSIVAMPGDPPACGEKVLLRESFGMTAGGHLPDGWSSSHGRFLLRPDFAVAGDDPSSPGRAAAAPSDTVSPGCAVVSEIMYAPGPGEPEWLELLNPGTGGVSIGGWTVADASGARSSPLPWIVIPAGERVILTRSAQMFTAARGEAACEVVTPGSLPSLNNGGDAVIVRSGAGTTIDSVAYLPAWGGAKGRSLERRSPRMPTGAANWGECEDSAGATPCAVNSIAVLPLDLSVSLAATYRIPPGAVASIRALLRNVGSEPVGDVEVRWFIDRDLDRAPDDAEEFARGHQAGPVRPADSLTVVAEWAAAAPGTHQLILVADVEGDGRPGNNVARAAVIVGHSSGSVVINEIMYQPLVGEPEYIELTGAGILPDLEGWTLQLGIRDDGRSGKSIPLKSTASLPGEAAYVVVASDSSLVRRFPSLGDSGRGGLLYVPGVALGLTNGGEVVRLMDPSGGTVDSVRYAPEWHNPAFTEVGGRSLEKIHPGLDGAARESWSTSVAPDGGTPGSRNSVVSPAGRSGSRLRADPNPFSPDADGRDDHTVVRYSLAVDAGYTVIRVFDVSGRLVRTLMERERGGYEGETVWDGRDDLSRRVRMGMYILHLEALDRRGVRIADSKAVVAVAGRL